ncbi:MAG: aminomethyl-transferring glycine dehydrogenase subunit GcvPA [bacterium]|nr:aminomethyl-transferring glycine dehydrogenase subunit GcvPA [bacterium]
MVYIPNTSRDKKEMFEAIGCKSIDDLFMEIDQRVKLKGKLKLPKSMSEMEVAALIKEIGKKNANLEDYISFLGGGAYEHFIPSVVKHIIGRSEFYTAYTPYQAEASQGTLQAIYEYQSLICELTGMDVSNASMYDGASAVSEAAFMASRITGLKKIIVSETAHPHYLQVLKTYTRAAGLELYELQSKEGIVDIDMLKGLIDDNTACVIIQNPNFFGCLEHVDTIEHIVHSKKSLFIMCIDPLSLGILAPPGEYGADIVVGEGQSLGNNLAFGGPYLGLFSCRKDFLRQLPGRIVGRTKDKNGKTGYVLTLQTREQHIRRARATSNICSNQALNALACTVYLSCMGKQGITGVGNLCLQKAHYAQLQIEKIDGYELKFKQPFFKEFLIQCPENPEEINKRLLEHKIIGGLSVDKFYPELKDCMLVCITEMRTKEQIDRFVNVLAKIS